MYSLNKRNLFISIALFLCSDPGFDWSSLKQDPTANWHIIGWLVCLLLLAITWIVTSVIITKHLKNY
jgi:hypothetical protein